ncbi:MAG TPA: ArsR family transcriptional regulator [Candidatus Aminicenantes bacterium]|nr:ArsR family transcriptional regulator [Candidatus Aminicenantes bacterium]
MTEHEKQRCGERAQVLKALAHPTRLWMVEQLSTGERCVCEFVNEIDADFSTISRHLSLLKAAGIIADEKRGRQVIYRLVVPCILNFMDCVEAVLKERSRALTFVMQEKP